jgi:copper chaperone
MEQTFKVEGMSCGHCVMSVKKELNKLNITDFKVEIGIVRINTEKNNTTSEVVIKAIEDAGYKVLNN